MADTAVAALTAASALTGTELFYGDDGVNDVKVTASQVKTWTSASPVLTGQTTIPSGTAAAPSIAQVGNLGSGFYFAGANQPAFAVSGVLKLDYGFTNASYWTIPFLYVTTALQVYPGDINFGPASIIRGTVDGQLGFFNNTGSKQLYISWPVSASLQLGGVDTDSNAAMLAQTLRTQGALTGGTNNQAGQNFTVIVSPGKGTGAGGQLILQTAPAGASGNTPNTPATALTLTAPAVNMQPSTVIGNQALATAATDGFLYIPTCAGTPTGVPTAFTGRVPMIYDTTNHKFYIYDGGWKGGTSPGAFT